MKFQRTLVIHCFACDGECIIHRDIQQAATSGEVAVPLNKCPTPETCTQEIVEALTIQGGPN